MASTPLALAIEQTNIQAQDPLQANEIQNEIIQRLALQLIQNDWNGYNKLTKKGEHRYYNEIEIPDTYYKTVKKVVQFSLLLINNGWECINDLPIKDSKNRDNQYYYYKKGNIKITIPKELYENISAVVREQVNNSFAAQNLKIANIPVNEFFDTLYNWLNNIPKKHLGAVCLGYTGSGKSTLINYMNGCKYELINDELQHTCSPNHEEIAKRGGVHSQTTYPKSIKIGEMYYTDTPGIEDTRDYHLDIIRELGFSELLKRRGIKYLTIVINANNFFEPPYLGLRKLSNMICRISSDTNVLQELCRFIIVKRPSIDEPNAGKKKKTKRNEDQISTLMATMNNIGRKINRDSNNELLYNDLQFLQFLNIMMSNPSNIFITNFTDDNLRQRLYESLKNSNAVHPKLGFSLCAEYKVILESFINECNKVYHTITFNINTLPTTIDTLTEKIAKLKTELEEKQENLKTQSNKTYDNYLREQKKIKENMKAEIDQKTKEYDEKITKANDNIEKLKKQKFGGKTYDDIQKDIQAKQKRLNEINTQELITCWKDSIYHPRHIGHFLTMQWSSKKTFKLESNHEFKQIEIIIPEAQLSTNSSKQKYLANERFQIDHADIFAQQTPEKIEDQKEIFPQDPKKVLYKVVYKVNKHAITTFKGTYKSPTLYKGICAVEIKCEKSQHYKDEIELLKGSQKSDSEKGEIQKLKDQLTAIENLIQMYENEKEQAKKAKQKIEQEIKSSCDKTKTEEGFEDEKKANIKALETEIEDIKNQIKDTEKTIAHLQIQLAHNERLRDGKYATLFQNKELLGKIYKDSLFLSLH